MSSFTCEHCGKSIIDNGGYITECEHYPMEGDEMKDELVERLSRQLKDARKTTDDLRVEFGKVVAEREMLKADGRFFIAENNVLMESNERLRDENESLREALKSIANRKDIYELTGRIAEQALKEKSE